MRKQLWSDVAGAGRGAQHPRDSTHGCEGTLWGPQFQLCQGPAGFGKQLPRSPLSGHQRGDPHSCPHSPGRDHPWDFWDCPAAGRKNPGMISLGKHLQDPQRGTRGGFRSWLIQGKLFFSRSQQPWRLLGRCLSPPRAGQGMCWKISAFPAAPEAQMLPLAAAARAQLKELFVGKTAAGIIWNLLAGFSSRPPSPSLSQM